MSPLTSATPREAAQQLAERRAQFRGERSAVRVRLPQISARGQLQVDGDGRMLLTVFTPLNTSAARLYVDRDQVIFLNDLQSTAWRGKPSDLVGALSAFGNGELPLLLVGLPASGMDLTYSPAGIERARVGDATVAFDPPVYPPKTVAIDHRGTHVEIQHLDSFVDPNPIVVPQIPSDYRCCVLPQL